MSELPYTIDPDTLRESYDDPVAAQSRALSIRDELELPDDEREASRIPLALAAAHRHLEES